MTRTSILSQRVKDRLGDLSVTTVLVLAYLLTGCGGDGPETRSGSTEVASEFAVQPVANVMVPVAAVQPSAPAEPEFTVPENVSFEEAETAYHSGKYREATLMFESYVGRKSENAWGHYMLGLAASKHGDLETAERALTAALERDPDHVKSLLNLSRVLTRAGRAGEAVPYVERAIGIDPTAADGHRVMGLVRDEMGEIDAAIEAFQVALRLDEGDAWSANNLGLVYLRAGRFGEALPPLARAVQLRDDIPVFQNNLGIVLERSGYFAAAAETFGRAMALDEGYEKARVNLERVQGRDDTALVPLDLEAIAEEFLDVLWEPTEPGESGPIDPDTTVIPTPPIEMPLDTIGR